MFCLSPGQKFGVAVNLHKIIYSLSPFILPGFTAYCLYQRPQLYITFT